MCSPAASPLPDIDSAFTDAEIFGSLEKMNRGYPPPRNVFKDIDPYKYMPSNLPGGVWYLIPSNENTSVQHGYWKANGEACKVFSNSFITGWRTTLEFHEGQVPHERKTDWVMQQFRITQKKLYESKEAEDASYLCRVFLSDKLSPNHEKQLKMSGADITSSTHIHSTLLSLATAKNDRSQSSTSKPQVFNDDDETREMAPMERPIDYLAENLFDTDYISGGDYLELDDLDYAASSPSSSENTSCVTMSSDECFDSLALLQELEPKNDRDLDQENTGYKYSFSTPHKPNEVVMLPESLISIERSKPPSEEICRTNSSMRDSAMANRDLDHKALKQVIRGQKVDYKDEGPSSYSQYQATSSDAGITVPNGKRKATVGRIKKLKKKYFCFMPF